MDNNQSLWIFQMPAGSDHNMEIDVRHGPTERQGGTIVRGPFDKDDYHGALEWIVKNDPKHPDYAPGWPTSHAARVLVDQESSVRYQDPLVYLTAGTVVFVQSDEGDHLIVTAHGMVGSYPLRKDHAIPVPNFLPADPEEMAAALNEDQALVGDLLNDGYTMFRVPADGHQKDVWERFIEANLGTDPLTLYWNDADGDVYIADDNPTTVSTATKVA